jgi:DNA-binding response OmpR family regulator
MNYKVLVVEDDFSINDILTFALKGEGYAAVSAFNAKEAKIKFEEFNPDLVLLDVNLPDESGFDLCKSISSDYKIPVIMLTARNDIIDKVLGLELGADDYITKPFHIKEVLARVKVALRRVDRYKDQGEDNMFIKLSDNVKVDMEKRIVLMDEEEVKLKPKEYDLLVFLIKNRDRVFSREELLDKVWGLDYEGDFRTVDIHVRRLRAKLDSSGAQSIIETVFGVGYVMRRKDEK